MESPLVSVIILSHNHERYLLSAFQSVINQNYSPVQVILVDDGSRDSSPRIIKEIKQEHPEIQIVLHPQSLGNCKAFNSGLALAKGKYIIDLAADDLLYPERIKVGVDSLENLDESFGVHFSDMDVLDEDGRFIKTHFARNEQGSIIEKVPEGNVFKDVLERYFIPTPSMMIKKVVFDKLGGYDENLHYEDFDFWVRSARKWNYAFSEQVLVGKRILKNSHSARQFQWGSSHQESTYRVCVKASKMLQTVQEKQSLKKRLRYEIRLALRKGNIALAMKYLKLLLC